MIRTLTVPLALTLAGASLGGCIIYEKQYSSTSCCGYETTSPPSQTTTPPTEPTEPGTTGVGQPITSALALSVSEGAVGETLLTLLQPTTGEIPISSVVSVVFDRDITVLDTIANPTDLLLLVDIADDAALGAVGVVARTDDGAAYRLAEPFRIVAAPVETGDTSDTGATTTSSTGDTGAGTGDTGASE